MPKRGVGRPTKYRPTFHPEDFVRQSRQGKTFAQIAAIWDVDRDTIQEWTKKHKEFSVAVKKGRQLAEAWYIALGQAAMVGKVMIDGEPRKVDLGFYVWMTKNMFKWHDKVQVEAKPISADEERPFKELSNETLTQLARKELK